MYVLRVVNQARMQSFDLLSSKIKKQQTQPLAKRNEWII